MDYEKLMKNGCQERFYAVISPSGRVSLEPENEGRAVDILERLQMIVGGWIEPIQTGRYGRVMFGNEDARALGLPINLHAEQIMDDRCYKVMERQGVHLRGNAVYCGVEGADIKGLTLAEIKMEIGCLARDSINPEMDYDTWMRGVYGYANMRGDCDAD